MNLVSVTMNLCTKMEVLPLLFFLTMVSAEEFITMRLSDIAEKYRHQSWGNAEFSRWIEKAYYASKKPKGNKAEKKEILDEFMQYDTLRQYLEDRITDRLNEIDSEMPNRKLSQVCVTEYQAQKDRLRKAYKFSNSEKQRILDSNSKPCTKEDETKKKDDKTDRAIRDAIKILLTPLPTLAPPRPQPPPPPRRKEILYSYELHEPRRSSESTETIVYNHFYSWWWG